MRFVIAMVFAAACTQKPPPLHPTPVEVREHAAGAGAAAQAVVSYANEEGIAVEQRVGSPNVIVTGWTRLSLAREGAEPVSTNTGTDAPVIAHIQVDVRWVITVYDRYFRVATVCRLPPVDVQLPRSCPLGVQARTRAFADNLRKRVLDDLKKADSYKPPEPAPPTAP